MVYEFIIGDTSANLPLMSLGLRGLGDAAQTNKIIATSTAGAGIFASVLPLMIAGTGPIGIGIAAAAALTQIIASFFQGCGQSCIQETNEVNKIEPYLKQNIQNWNNLTPEQKTVSVQAAYLNVFDSAADQIKQFCGNPQFGQSGQNCINERFDKSSCKWRDSNNNCWNWVIGYRDPIANDPEVHADPSPISSVMNAGNDITSLVSSMIPNSPIVMIGGLAIIAGLIFISSRK